jgi:hypothetical protein
MAVKGELQCITLRDRLQVFPTGLNPKSVPACPKARRTATYLTVKEKFTLRHFFRREYDEMIELR